MPIKTAISWDWATNWLKTNLIPYMKNYADDPQELRYRTDELIEDEVTEIYTQKDYYDKKSQLISLKELYESLQASSDEDWNDLLEYIFPSQIKVEQPAFEQILESIEPRQQMSMEDVDEPVEQLEITEIETKPSVRRPIESIMIRHPKIKEKGLPIEFLAGPGAKVYNGNTKDIGIIDTIYEDVVMVKSEKTGQLEEWLITDPIWESQ
ncbi:hypothetical protein LCGC14_2528280 [marine sediment metagenome]|uniref:Uncharacterized protein n=1 Tax=marine sediment metagenome TaxID=412755 RepID=A0A0F9D5X1_9ZZZZ